MELGIALAGRVAHRHPAQHPWLPGSSIFPSFPSALLSCSFIHWSVRPSIHSLMRRVLRAGYGPGLVLGSGRKGGNETALRLAFRERSAGNGGQAAIGYPLPTMEPWALQVGGQPCEAGQREPAGRWGQGRGCLSQEVKLGLEMAKEGMEVGAWQTEPAGRGLLAWGRLAGVRGGGAGGHTAPAGLCSGSAQSWWSVSLGLCWPVLSLLWTLDLPRAPSAPSAPPSWWAPGRVWGSLFLRAVHPPAWTGRGSIGRARGESIWAGWGRGSHRHPLLALAVSSAETGHWTERVVLGKKGVKARLLEAPGPGCMGPG